MILSFGQSFADFGGTNWSTKVDQIFTGHLTEH
jgi:hypothetical protein